MIKLKNVALELRTYTYVTFLAPTLLIVLAVLFCSVQVYAATKPGRGAQINWSHPLARGLVGCWLFNEGTGSRVFDLSGYGNHGTLTNTPTWVNGDDGSAINYVSTSSQYIDCGSIRDIQAPITIVTKVYCDTSFATWDGIVGRNSNLGFEYAIYWKPSVKQAKYAFKGSGVTKTVQTPTNFLKPDAWNIIVATYDLVNMRIYANGLEGGSLATTVTPAPGSSGNHSIRLGDAQGAGVGTMDGKQAWVYLYDRALTAAEVAQLCREPYGMFERPTDVAAFAPVAAPPARVMILDDFRTR